MFAVFYSILIVIAVLGACGDLIMRIRITQREPYDKIAWWRRGGDRVADAYEELFPNSPLLLLRRFAFWLLLASSGAALLAILWQSR